MADELVEHCVSLRPELDYFCASPQTLIGTVETKGVEDYAGFIAQDNYSVAELLLRDYTRKARWAKSVAGFFIRARYRNVTAALPLVYDSPTPPRLFCRTFDE